MVSRHNGLSIEAYMTLPKIQQDLQRSLLRMEDGDKPHPLGILRSRCREYNMRINDRRVSI